MKCQIPPESDREFKVVFFKSVKLSARACTFEQDDGLCFVLPRAEMDDGFLARPTTPVSARA